MKQNVIELNSDNEVDFVYETCSICGEEMTDVNNIRLDFNTDNYVCCDCNIRYELKAVRCRDI